MVLTEENKEVTGSDDYSVDQLRSMIFEGKDAGAPAEQPKPDATPISAPSEATPAEGNEPQAEAVPKETAPESDTGDLPKGEQEDKKQSKIDRRLATLTRRNKEAEEANAELRRKLEDIEAKLNSPGPTKTAEPAKATETPGKPVPVDEDNFDGTYEELKAAKAKYVDDMVQWGVADALARRDAEAAAKVQQAKVAEVTSAWESRAKKATEADPEVADAIATLGPVVSQAGLADLFKLSEVGPQMLLHLYQNPDEAARIVSLGHPALMAKELGKLESQLLPKPSSSTNTAKGVKSLPTPIETVGGKSAVSSGFDFNSDKADMSSFSDNWLKATRRT